MKKRRITKAKISFVSLVSRGANQMPVLYKADGGVEFQTLVKASEDVGELTAVVYAPERRDSQGDIASAEVIKQMAHEFQKAGGQIDLMHDGKPVGKDRAYVAETFIIAKGDERFAGWKDYDGNDAGDLTGAWAVVIKIEDEALRQLYRDGKWNGVSMGGVGEVVVEKDDEAPPGWFHSLMRKLGLYRGEEEIDVKPEELKELIKASLTEAVAALKTTEPVAKTEEPKAPELDLTDAKAVEQHLAKLRTAELSKGVDFSDPAQVKEYLAKLEKLAPTPQDPKEREIAELKAKLAKLEGKSNQSPTDGEGTNELGLAKDEAKDWNDGVALAKAFLGKKD